MYAYNVVIHDPQALLLAQGGILILTLIIVVAGATLLRWSSRLGTGTSRSEEELIFKSFIDGDDEYRHRRGALRGAPGALDRGGSPHRE
jgi:hypothetical protein